jgi:hypothetical protein
MYVANNDFTVDQIPSGRDDTTLESIVHSGPQAAPIAHSLHAAEFFKEGCNFLMAACMKVALL